MGLTPEQRAEINNRAIVESYSANPLSDDVLALLDQLDQAERERDEARAEAESWERSWRSSNAERNVHRDESVRNRLRAEKAEAALERVEKHLARPLTWAESMQRMPNGQPFPRMEDPETILALIRDETGGDR